MQVQVVDVPVDDGVRRTLAEWSLAEWAGDFPGDTIDWYLDLYDASARADGLPVCLMAVIDGRPVGTASLIEDDELPGATEPGPWVAAVFVEPGSRRAGVGAALVAEAVRRGHAMGFDEIYLYTEAGASWYEKSGWQAVRTAELAGHDVTVMVHREGVTTT